MLKKIICFFTNHEWKETRELYGTLNNGAKCYKQLFGDCTRCGKKRK